MRTEYAIGDHVVGVGAPAVKFILRVKDSDGRKFNELKLNTSKGVIILRTRPENAGNAMAFAESKQEWMRDVQKRLGMESVKLGMKIPIGGVDHEIASANVNEVTLKDGKILIPEGTEQIGNAIRESLKENAKGIIHESARLYADMIGASFNQIKMRDASNRWGSCSRDSGNLMISWRVIMAPPDVLDYLVAHEVAHLIHPNHSDEFWELLKSMIPDCDRLRNILKNECGFIMRYNFDF